MYIAVPIIPVNIRN